MSDEPTVLSLEDIVSVFKQRGLTDWQNDEYLVKIFIWNSGIYLRSHAEEVAEKYSVLELCKEYWEHNTIKGIPLPKDFSNEALMWLQAPYLEQMDKIIYQNHETAPVRNAYWKTDNS